MLYTRKADGYDAAVQAGDVVTLRLRCINRELAQDPPRNGISEEARKKIACALRNHLINCEGVDKEMFNI